MTDKNYERALEIKQRITWLNYQVEIWKSAKSMQIITKNGGLIKPDHDFFSLHELAEYAEFAINEEIKTLTNEFEQL